MSQALRATPSDRLPGSQSPLTQHPRASFNARPHAPSGGHEREHFCAPLARLCATLDAIFEASEHSPEPSDSAFFARAMRSALAEAAADPASLTPAQREGSTQTYRRHMLAADPRGRYAIAALVWHPSQASPVHAHHTWCGYAVLEGKLTETIFEWNDAQHCASATRTHTRRQGAMSFVRGGRGGIHRLGNSSDAPAVSLHIYGVPGTQIATHVNDIVRVADATALV